MTEADDAMIHQVALDAIQSWGNLDELVQFAQARHGYGNSDGMCGVTYPDDLDDYDRTMGANIPEGSVEVYAWYGAADGPSYVMPEETYQAILRRWLSNQGRDDLARHLPIG